VSSFQGSSLLCDNFILKAAEPVELVRRLSFDTLVRPHMFQKDDEDDVSIIEAPLIQTFFTFPILWHSFSYY
jgi:hypothetical protein